MNDLAYSLLLNTGVEIQELHSKNDDDDNIKKKKISDYYYNNFW